MTESAKKLGNEQIQQYTTMGLPDSDGNVEVKIHDGLTKREYFAGLAMQGMFANGGAMTHANYKTQDPAEVVKVAKYAAECLLEELSKTE